MTWTFTDLVRWAEASAQPADAVYEARKVPARLGLADDDLALIPADLGHFEAIVAPSGYAVVSRSKNLEAARRRGNARLRALLKRFHASPSPAPAVVGGDHRPAWTALIDHVASLEGFTADGALVSTGTSRGLSMFRARADVAPLAMTSAEIERINHDLSAGKRKTLGKSVRTWNRLVALRDADAGLARLLPPQGLDAPKPADRRPRTDWSALPAPFLASVEVAMTRATETVSDQARETRANIAAGADREAAIHTFNTRRTRNVSNRAAARASYRAALGWAIQGAVAAGTDPATLTDVRQVLTTDAIEAAISGHVARARASHRLRDPRRTQTIWSPLKNLGTLARYGLRDPDLAMDLKLLGYSHHEVVRGPGEDGMAEEALRFCKQILQSPRCAANLINAPERIAQAAERKLTEAREAGSLARESRALRLYASAVLFAMQMSRPVRRSNLIRARVSGAGGALNRLVWLKPAEAAEIRFPKGEVKNRREVTMPIQDSDARLLRRWTQDLRARWMELKGIAESPYLLPGKARPRLLKDGIELPTGCLSNSAFAEIWAEGAAVIGLDLKPHMSRHAVATLTLALHPGNYALAASILADTEETVERHYGHEDGKRASAQIRKELLRVYPNLNRAIAGRRTAA